MAQAKELVTRYFGRVPKSDRVIPREYPREPPSTAERRVTVNENWPLPAVIVAYPITYDGNPDSYPLHLTSKILSDGDSSRIYKSLVYEKGIARVGVRRRQHHRRAEPVLRGRARGARAHARRGREGARRRVRQAAHASPSPSASCSAPRISSSATTSSIASRFAERRASWRMRWSFTATSRRPTAKSRSSPNMKVSDLQRVAKTYFTPESRLVLRILPKTPGAADACDATLAGSDSSRSRPACRPSAGPRQVANWPSENPPRPLPSRPVSFPPYELRTLPNGMQVIVVMHHEQPEVTMRMLVRAGAAYDPPGKSGTASLVGLAAQSGHDHPQRAGDCRCHRFDRRRARHRRRQRRDVGQRARDEGQLRRRHGPARRRRPASGLSRPKRSIGSGSRRSRTWASASRTPTSSRGAVLNRLIYGFHPYGFPDSGMPDTIAKITRDDLREFHRRYFAPNNSILAIVGDVTADEAMAAATRVFGDWQRQAVQPPALPEPPQAHAAHRRRRQARLGADRGAGRPARRSAEDAGLHGAGSGDPHPGRRGQQSAVPRAAVRARASRIRRRPT